MESIDSKEDTTLTIKKIIDVLECTTCLEVPEECPIYQCEKGHILCFSCREKLVDCPVCKVPLGWIRSLTSEKILDQCSRSCEFEKYGCKAKVHDMNSEAHKDDCQYKPTTCMEADCEETMPINDFANHMKDRHGVQMSDAFTISCDIQKLNFDLNNNDCQVRTAQFSSGGRQFFTSIFIDRN